MEDKMRTVVGITGQKGSGKDTLGEAMEGFEVIKMADPLKDMIRTMYRAAGIEDHEIERKIEGDLKETPCGILGGATPRHAMQTLGSEWAKMVDPSHRLWSRIWLGKAIRSEADIVCTDIRFPHEVAAVHSLGGEILRVERPDQKSTDNHASETEMLSLDVDHTFCNDGSIADLHKAAREMMK
jgi:energy-coupling factor transporter ATP-binding protein EcfA2